MASPYSANHDGEDFGVILRTCQVREWRLNAIHGFRIQDSNNPDFRWGLTLRPRDRKLFRLPIDGYAWLV